MIVSWPAKDEDRSLAPSPLIAHIPGGSLELPEYGRHRDLIFKARSFVHVEDARGPAVPPGPVRGGTRVLAEECRRLNYLFTEADQMRAEGSRSLH